MDNEKLTSILKIGETIAVEFKRCVVLEYK